MNLCFFKTALSGYRLLITLSLSSILLFFLCSCSVKSKTCISCNYQPLFDYHFDPERDFTEIHIAGPFFKITKSPKKFEFDIRPLYSKISSETPNRTQIDYLYPLGLYKETPQGSSNRLSPLFSGRKSYGNPKSGFGFFPFFWGTTSKGEKYGGFFPFYGTLRERFGKDKISFTLWPIYSETILGETRKTSILWPIFAHIKGPGETGVKVWPLFGSHTRERDFRKRYYLWPLIFNEATELGTTTPHFFNAFLPFYVSDSHPPDRRTMSFLWPFFNFASDRRIHFTLVDFPWPIIQWAKGDKRSTLKVFPFFGKKVRPESESGFILWPLYSYYRESSKNSVRDTYRFLLLSKLDFIYGKNGKTIAEKKAFWPFFFFKKDADGKKNMKIPYLIPVESGKFDRILAPLFTLYRYRVNSTGNEESRGLWGLYIHRKNYHGEFRSLSFLFEYNKTDEELKISFLKGLFEYSAGQNENYLKLFYIKFASN